MSYFRQVIMAPHSLRRQQYYAMRHCIRKGRWLFASRSKDAAGRDDQYYIREALALCKTLGIAGNKGLF